MKSIYPPSALFVPILLFISFKVPFILSNPIKSLSLPYSPNVIFFLNIVFTLTEIFFLNIVRCKNIFLEYRVYIEMGKNIFLEFFLKNHLLPGLYWTPCGIFGGLSVELHSAGGSESLRLRCTRSHPCLW